MMYFRLPGSVDQCRCSTKRSYYAVFFVWVTLAVISAGGTGCNGEKNGNAGKAPVVYVRSPFSGEWISEDSDRQTAFSLSIEQQKDSLFGNFCLVTASGQKCDCYMPGLANSGRAFAVIDSGETTIEMPVTGYLGHTAYGRLHLTAAEDKLYWRIVEAPDGNNFTIKQTTFIRDTSFH